MNNLNLNIQLKILNNWEMNHCVISLVSCVVSFWLLVGNEYYCLVMKASEF